MFQEPGPKEKNPVSQRKINPIKRNLEKAPKDSLK